MSENTKKPDFLYLDSDGHEGLDPAQTELSVGTTLANKEQLDSSDADRAYEGIALEELSAYIPEAKKLAERGWEKIGFRQEFVGDDEESSVRSHLIVAAPLFTPTPMSKAILGETGERSVPHVAAGIVFTPNTPEVRRLCEVDHDADWSWDMPTARPSDTSDPRMGAEYLDTAKLSEEEWQEIHALHDVIAQHSIEEIIQQNSAK